MNENDVIAALKKHLCGRDYIFVSECHTTEQGIDLVMKKGRRELRIEAKGSTSSREGSRRYGKQFTDAQCHDHFSRAFFKACQLRDAAQAASEDAQIAIAFSHTRHFQKYADRTKLTRKHLGITLFWLKGAGVVEEE